MKALLCTLIAAVSLVLALPVFAKDNHALLIGAATYPNLDERYWLNGPTNDVLLVRDYLLGSAPIPFSAGNITVLADGIEGAPDPTLAAIQDAMAGLADRVGPDDFVYLHFSGHGSQMPAMDADSEPDGLDEVFLPVDVGVWDDTIGRVPNVLVDDEIGRMIQAIRDKGATVWAVFDTCHSGTITRAAPVRDKILYRRLGAQALGVPSDVIREDRPRSIGGDRETPLGLTGKAVTRSIRANKQQKGGLRKAILRLYRLLQ